MKKISDSQAIQITGGMTECDEQYYYIEHGLWYLVDWDVFNYCEENDL